MYLEVDVETLQRMRINQGLSQRGLAKRAGISNTTLWKLENGTSRAHPATLKKIADVLGVQPVELLTEGRR